MVSKILRADGTTELASIKSVTYHESVNADTDLRPGCVASSYIEVTCFGAQTDAPTVGEALTYYQVVGETETLIGIFYAEPSIPTKNSYSFIAYDAVHKLDSDFSSWLSAHQDDFPYTVYQLVSQACTIAGVTLGLSSWANSTMEVNAWYADSITCRNILQYAAEIACKFVRCNTSGEIVFDWYTTVSQDTRTASGEIASFDYGADGVPLKSLVAQIDPVQSFNGYDKPWPPGGGKNVFNADVWAGGTYVSFVKNGENDYTFTKVGTSTSQRMTLNGEFTVPAGTYYLSFKASAQSESGINVRTRTDGAWKTGVLLTYADGYYYRKLTVPENTTGIQMYYSNNSTGVGTSINISDVQIEEGSSQTDYAPYENECPITGWDECSAYLSDNAPTTYIDGKYYNDNGGISNSEGTRYEEEYLPVTPEASYTFQFINTSTYRLRVHEYSSDKTWLRQVISTPVSTTTISYEPSNDAKYIRLSYPIACGNIELYISKLQVSWQSTAGTVYNGTITINEDGSADLANYSTYSSYSSSNSWQESNTPGVFYLSNSAAWRTEQTLICDKFKGVANKNPNQLGLFEIAITTNLNSFVVRTDDPDVDTFKARLDAMGGFHAVRQRVEPLVYHFDNVGQLTTLLGENNIWATTGDVTVEYYYQLGRIYPTTGTFNDEECYAYKQDGLNYDNYDTSALARVAVHPVGEDDVAYYYPTDVTSGNTLDITNNALLYGASAADMSGIAQTVYDGVTAVGQYRPMDVNMFPNECPFRSGQIVPVTDAQGVSFTTAIMQKVVTDSAVTLTSTGREVYGDYALDTAKKLVQLAADIVRINKLKVDWAEIDQIFARDITVTGQLHSEDYSYTDGEIYANQGMGMDFGEKRYNTPNFGITPDGNVYAQGGKISGFHIQKGEYEEVTPSAPTYTGTGYTYADGYLEVTEDGTATFDVPLTATVGGVSKPLTRVVYQCYYGQPSSIPSTFRYSFYYLDSGGNPISGLGGMLEYEPYGGTALRSVIPNANYLSQSSSLTFSVQIRSGSACRIYYQYGNYYSLYTENGEIGTGETNVYVGDDGISVGGKIILTPDGNAKIYSLDLTDTAGVASPDDNRLMKAKDIYDELSQKVDTSLIPFAVPDGGTGQTGVEVTSTVSDVITASTNYTVTSMNFSKWGKVAQLTMKIKRSSAVTITSLTAIATLKSGYRPAHNAIAASPASAIDKCYVNESGVIYVTGTLAANTEYSIFSTFILP